MPTDRITRSVGYAHWHYSADVPNAPAVGGWCWAENETTEFVGPKGLREDVLWLTNLPWEYHVALGANNFRHIKRIDFLPVPLDRLAQELNITPDMPEAYANAMGVLGQRLIMLGMRCYGERLLEQCLEQNTFAQAIAHTLGFTTPTDPSFLDVMAAPTSPQLDLSATAEVHREVWRNVAPYASLRHDTPREDCAVLRAQWFEHASSVLACPLPTLHEPWVEIEVAAADRLRYLQSEDLPALVEVLDVGLTSSWNALYDFSSTPHRWSRRRRWMCGMEVLFLTEIGAVEIGRIFVQPAGYVCDAMSWSLPAAGDALTLSPSAGLLAHAHWLSGAIPLTHRFWPARSMWLRASDRLRLACMLPALQGIPTLKLVSYGEGALYVHGSEEAIAEAIRRAPQVGLLPTPSMWSRTQNHTMTREESWVPDTFSPFAKAALRMSNRKLSDLLRLDAASIYSLTDESAAVREMASILKEVSNA